MSLESYKQKRDFGKTKEPLPKSEKKKDKNLIFVVHFHKASHDHFDLRLEMDGVLRSWAIPKTPPKIKGEKRLAIQVEDHPLEYAKFHGTIPEGNYGAGEVKIWDEGDYELIKKYPDRIIFELHGKKLKGRYCLVKAHFKNKKSWLFFKI